MWNAATIRARSEARRYSEYLRGAEAELEHTGQLQHRALERLYPENEQLRAPVRERRFVWERRPDDDDFLRVRIGKGSVPLEREIQFDGNPPAKFQEPSRKQASDLVDRRRMLHSAPVVVDLSEIGVLEVTGSLSRSRAWARSLMVHLAAACAPQDLRIITCVQTSAEWEWSRLLPHHR